MSPGWSGITVMLLDFGPAVTAVASQPFWLHWHDGRRRRRHAPDFFARLAGGTGVVIDVRADDRIGPEDAEAFEVTSQACSAAGWEFRRVGTVGPLLAGAAEAGDSLAVLPVLFHLAWRQELAADLACGPLGPGWYR